MKIYASHWNTEKNVVPERSETTHHAREYGALYRNFFEAGMFSGSKQSDRERNEVSMSI